MNTLKKLLTLLFLGITLVACNPEGYQPEVHNIGQEMILLPGHAKPTLVTYQVIDDLAIFEGDVILGNVDSKGQLIQSELESQGTGIEGDNFRWPGGVIPFVIGGNWGANDAAMRTAINTAVQHWNTNTVIRLVPRTTEADFVNFMNGTGCSSFVGRQGGGQTITLQSNATGVCNFGAIVHEIGHAAGLWHEQSREDRDSRIIINWQNIQPGMEFNFNKHVTDGFDIGAYDYGSIMHYGATAFSKNGLPTITTIPAGIPIGQRNGLSAGDRTAVQTLYGGFFSLRVTITGDATTIASPGVQVRRANGQVVGTFFRTTTTTLSSLKAGDYTVTAPSWDIGGPTKPFWIRYSPDKSSQKVTVPPLSGISGTATVTVDYRKNVLKGFEP